MVAVRKRRIGTPSQGRLFAAGLDRAGRADVDRVVGEVIVAAQDFIAARRSRRRVGPEEAGSVKLVTGIANPGRPVRQLAGEVDRVALQSGADLFQVAGAVDAAGLFTRLLQRGEQHTGEDRDNRDDDQQLDEGESTTLLHLLVSFPEILCTFERPLQLGSASIRAALYRTCLYFNRCGAKMQIYSGYF